MTHVSKETSSQVPWIALLCLLLIVIIGSAPGAGDQDLVPGEDTAELMGGPVIPADEWYSDLVAEGDPSECDQCTATLGENSSAGEAGQQGATPDDNRNNPLEVILSISSIPLVGEETTVTCTVVSAVDTPGTRVEVSLPPQVDLISGTTSGEWDLAPEVPVTFDMVIKFTKPRDYQIIAKAKSHPEDSRAYAAHDALFLTIGIEQSGPTPPPQYVGSAIPVGAEQPALAPSSEITVEAHNARVSGLNPPPLTREEEAPPGSLAAGTVTVTGGFFYDTKVVGGTISDYRDAETGLVPMQGTLVEIVNYNTKAHLAWTYTDQSGSFSVPITNPYPDPIGFNLYAFMWYNPAHRQDFRVIYQGSTLTGLTDVWAITHTIGVIPSSATTYDIGGWRPIPGSDHLHAFWLYQDLIRMWYSLNDMELGSSTIMWYAAQTPANAAYYNFGSYIFLGGLEFKSADVTVHEFGHNFMWTARGAWSNDCPSPHYINYISAQRCGYTEGWANFLCMAVNGNGIYSWSSGSSLNLDTPTWGTTNWQNGDYCEGRVAGALYDMYDSQNDGYDVYSYGIDQIKTVMRTNTGWDFRSFWNRWLASGYSSNAASCLYQNTISYGMTLTVVSPNGGETWHLGSGPTIQWNYAGDIGPMVTIEVIKGDTVIKTISGYPIGSGGTGSLSLTVPSITPLGADYKVRIKSTSLPGLTDTSNAPFTISSPITVVAPNGGETWVQGTPQTIRWNYVGTPGSTVNIEALKGTSVLTIIPNIPIGLGSFPLTVPYNSPPGSDYRIRVSSTSDSALTDTSNAPFTIKSAITVTSPNGGENWKPGSTHPLTWTYTGNPGAMVKIEAIRGTTVLAVVTPSTSIGSGSYSVFFPYNTPLGTDYRIRITSTTYPGCTDMSNGDFTLSAV